ncbi:3-alpha-(or 20-beta)-hydroxysteroid dehydrogenase [Sinobacterium norvegicum]|uniref:3-alpha-(Or 20-beta)-hydroxysteroid dehydrogenase n=1 Tax=Sinobacterium norvegicum TaxID=1641715 RepID=A0ABM9AE77_9GAMM|nr:SDR family oxidoreductase [Sinobacterium norvegicum]CAH0991012.1 3-alpha-(or 20-beta)-hydroxysteroid dehydrogenase [Sinobacterium norvegicum]
MDRFKGQTVVVTGGASGIGAAAVRGIIAEGGKVLIADLQEKEGQALSQSLGDAALFLKTDVTSEQDIIAAIECAERELGPLTGMVNNAGIIGAIGSITETSVEAFDRTMAILTRGVFLGVKHAARVMKPHGAGAIVSVTSTAGVMGGLGPHTYTMAKHGVVGLTKSAASELSGYGIRINAVAPGATVTPLTSALTGGDTAQITQNIAAATPLGKACMPEDIADGILYLLSNEARFITGHTLMIDAGVTTSLLQTTFHGDQSETLLHAGQREQEG